MTVIGLNFFGVFVSERLWVMIRRISLHSSFAGFGADFMHSQLGDHMVMAHWFEMHHEVIITWCAFAAVLIVYIDDHFHSEKEEHKKEHDGSWTPVEETVTADA